jgi:L-asparaginase
MNQNNKLHFIMTGGTIDSYYDGTKDTAVPNEHSVLPKFIKILKLYEECEFTEICMKDSRELNESDRKKILKVIADSKAKRIIITHGTYTLPDTARYLKANIKDNDKTIIFVCSMIPLEGFIPTDAGFNIGYAVAKSQELSKGIYVCMNGRIFAPDEVVKLIGEGRFGSIYTK